MRRVGIAIAGIRYDPQLPEDADAPGKWTDKRERQYEHIKESLKERGKSEDTAEEIAARTVNKERARAGESKTASRTSLEDISSGPARRPALAPRRRRAHPCAALCRGGEGEHQGPLEDDQGRARARRRPLKSPTRRAPHRRG